MATAKKPLLIPIEQKSLVNDFFRRVLYTSKESQVIFITLQPGEDLGFETHKKTEQMFYVISGRGVAKFKASKKLLDPGDFLIVPIKTKHNIENTGKRKLKLLSIYSMPVHLENVIHRTKEDAEEDKSDLAFGHDR
jgi:mannose-6-phosphate isomerase-like protein (cupin superfamily)